MLSPDGKALASAGEDRQVKVWDPATGKLRWSLAVEGKVPVPVAFSPDGTVLAVGESDGRVRLLDSRTGRAHAGPILSGHQNGLFALSYSPDGKLLATAGRDGTGRLWDAATGKEKGTIHQPLGVWSVEFSPDGRTVAIPGNRGIDLWEVEPLKKRRTLTAARCVYTRTFFADGGRVLIGGVLTDSLAVWDVTTGQLRDTVLGHFVSDSPVAVSSDGKMLIAATTSPTVHLWEVASGREFARIHSAGLGWVARDGVTAVTVASGGKMAAAANKVGAVVCWDPTAAKAGEAPQRPILSEVVKLEGKKVERLTLDGCEWRLGHVVFSPDGKLLYIAARTPDVPGAVRTDGSGLLGFVRVWDVAAKKELGVLPPPGVWRFGRYLGEAMSPVVALTPSPDGKLLAVATTRDFKVWDVTRRKEARVVTPGTDSRNDLPLDPSSLSFSPDGKRLVASGLGGPGGGTVIWDVAGKKEMVRVQGTGAATFFARGKYIATAEYHNRVHLWETATGKQLAEDHPRMGILRGVGVSENNQWLVAGGEGGGMIWKIKDAETSPSLARHVRLEVRGPVYELAVSANGGRALTAGRTAQLWDMATGRELAGFPMGASVVGCALSPDGKTAAILVINSASNDFREGGIYLWQP